jgi:hypothetical protein
MLETLKDALQKRKYPCAVKTFYNSLNELDQDILMSVLSNPSVSHSSLEKALKAQAGVTLADTTIARHRQGRCSCSRI